MNKSTDLHYLKSLSPPPLQGWHWSVFFRLVPPACSGPTLPVGSKKPWNEHNRTWRLSVGKVRWPLWIWMATMVEVTIGDFALSLSLQRAPPDPVILLCYPSSMSK